MPNNPPYQSTAATLGPSASSPADLSFQGGQQSYQQYQQQQQQHRQRPPPPPSTASSVSSSSGTPSRAHRAVSFTPEATSRAAATASLADFLRSTGPDGPPPPPQPVAISPAPPVASTGSVSKKGGGIFGLGRRKKSRPSSDTTGTGDRSSTSDRAAASMAVGGQDVGGVRGVETVVTASGKTVNIIPYKAPHLPPLAGSDSFDSVRPTSSAHQDLHRVSSAGPNPYAMSFPLGQTSTGFPTPGGGQGALNVLAQARDGGRRTDGGYTSQQRPGGGIKRTDSAPSDVQGTGSGANGGPSHPPTAYPASPPRAQVSRRPNTGGSEQPSASPPHAFGATARDAPPAAHPSSNQNISRSQRPSTAPSAEPIQPTSAKAPSATVPPAMVLSAAINPPPHPSSTSYSAHPPPLSIARADSPTDPGLTPPAIVVTDRSPELPGTLDVALVNTRLHEQISMLELLGHRIEQDKDGKMLVGRRVERRSIATQVGAPGLTTLIAPRRASSAGETATQKEQTPAAAPAAVVSGAVGRKMPATSTAPGPASVRMGSASSGSGSGGLDSSPEFFTPTGSSDGTFIGSNSDDSLLDPTASVPTASSSSASTPLTSTTFSSASTTPTTPSTSNVATPRATTRSNLPATAPTNFPAVSRKKTSGRPSTSPELATRGVFGGDAHALLPTQEEKDRERRITYLEEKVRREVERRKEAEGAVKRLDRSSVEQQSKWEDMAGWALDVMERSERERTVLRTENVRLKRELDLWKMKAQVAESGRHMEAHAAEDASDQSHRSAEGEPAVVAHAQVRKVGDEEGDGRDAESRASSGLFV